MPRWEVTDDAVILRLTYPERLITLSGDVRVPLAQVVSATVSQSPWTDARWSGLSLSYVLGTGLPFLFTSGHTLSLSGVDFVWLTRNVDATTNPALVVVTRPPHRIRTIVVTAADALELARRINVAAAQAAFAARRAKAAADAGSEAPAGAAEADAAADAEDPAVSAAAPPEPAAAAEAPAEEAGDAAAAAAPQQPES